MPNGIKPLTVKAASAALASMSAPAPPRGSVAACRCGGAVAVGGPSGGSFRVSAHGPPTDAERAALAVAACGLELGHARAEASVPPGAGAAMKRAGWSETGARWSYDAPPRRGSMRPVPLSHAEATEWVRRTHSRLPPSRGALFAVGVAGADGRTRCVAQAGLPRSRALMAAAGGEAAEVVRLACDGTPNAASAALGAVVRALRALGYSRVVSYTELGDSPEAGGSYVAAGWRPTATSRGGSWSRPSRGRGGQPSAPPKVRWEAGPGGAYVGREREAEILREARRGRRDNPGRRTACLRVGTTVYHGTYSLDDFADLDGPAWVTKSRYVAVKFSGAESNLPASQGRPRVHVYRVKSRQRLLVFRSAADIERFLESRGYEPSDAGHPAELADIVCASGYDGWTVPGNYPPGDATGLPGDDTMLCNPSDVLEFVREEEP